VIARAGAAGVGLLLLVALSGIGQASNGRTLVLPGSVVSLSAEGPRVAIQSSNESPSCDNATFWTVTTGTVATLPCKSPVSGKRFADLTIAGATAIWWDYDSGNHVYCSDVYTTPLAHPTAEHPLGICDGTEGDTYYEFAGDNTITAIVDYSVCEADCVGDNGDLLPDGDYSVEVRRVVGGKLRTVLAPVNFRRFLDARNWRVAVVEPKGVLAVYDTEGKKLWSAAGAGGLTGGWISGNSVVVQQGHSVRVYFRAGVGLIHSLPNGAHVNDVAGGLAVYTVGSSVHLLRLSDGRDRRIVTIKGLAGAQITPAGVFYAVNVPIKGGRRGLVTFVPIGAALQTLR
jgi:hypothetical protein